ncbi:ABC transporter substrate-binding protein [Rheinheimera texasensis]|uniref:ABC transporter substrate-binding protein n=1 Tax=Rheinheimera texasensis TaxID=306205 RepID=UPI0032B219C1
MTDFNRPLRSPLAIAQRPPRQTKYAAPPEVLWYSRCPVPTPLGMAVRMGWLEQEFRRDIIRLQAVPDDLEYNASVSYEEHHLYGSFRQGNNTAALWAKAWGADTLLVGLNWLDEAQLLLVREDSAIQSLADLAGKKLALPVSMRRIDAARASTMRGFTNILALAGVAESAVQFVDIEFAAIIGREFDEPVSAGYARLAEALQTGRVDAIFVKGAKGVELAAQPGFRQLYDLRQHPDPLVRANNSAPRPITVDAALWREHPQLVLRFLNRVLQVDDFARAHPDATAEYVAEESRSTVHWVRQAYGDDLHLKQNISLDPIALSALSHYKDFLFSRGFIPANFDLDHWVEPLPLRILQAERERRVATQLAAQRQTPSYQDAVASLW